jgi:hypothetical protein
MASDSWSPPAAWYLEMTAFLSSTSVSPLGPASFSVSLMEFFQPRHSRRGLLTGAVGSVLERVLEAGFGLGFLGF